MPGPSSTSTAEAPWQRRSEAVSATRSASQTGHCWGGGGHSGECYAPPRVGGAHRRSHGTRRGPRTAPQGRRAPLAWGEVVVGGKRECGAGASRVLLALARPPGEPAWGDPWRAGEWRSAAPGTPRAAQWPRACAVRGCAGRRTRLCAPRHPAKHGRPLRTRDSILHPRRLGAASMRPRPALDVTRPRVCLQRREAVPAHPTLCWSVLLWPCFPSGRAPLRPPRHHAVCALAPHRPHLPTGESWSAPSRL